MASLPSAAEQVRRRIVCPEAAHLAARYWVVRSRTMALAGPLSPEDMTPQAEPDCSPAKWHLAHTSWFFDRMVLRERGRSPAPVGRYDTLFNSYYVALGARERRDARGLMTRPSVAEVLAYREAVDDAMLRVLESAPGEDALAALIELGLQHEEQHQELLLSDVLALFALNPLAPAYLPSSVRVAERPQTALTFARHPGGLLFLGADEAGFAYDNERPRHRVYQEPFGLADRLVSNGEWAAFIADGGYDTPTLWLSDGWSACEREGWRAPRYWREGPHGEPLEFTLAGLLPRRPEAPVRHISFYEADAFARWAGKRLPTEAELEWGAPPPCSLGFDTLEDLAAALAEPDRDQGLWQWSASAYRPYPGFKPLGGAASEYNGKFMANQMVLRGGAYATPRGHARATYRNFYYPAQRWMFAGLRLAEDA